MLYSIVHLRGYRQFTITKKHGKMKEAKINGSQFCQMCTLLFGFGATLFYDCFKEKRLLSEAFFVHIR